MPDEYLSSKELRWLEAHTALAPQTFFDRFFRYRARLKRRTEPKAQRRALLLMLLTNINDGIKIEDGKGKSIQVPPYFSEHLEARLRAVDPEDSASFCAAARDLVRGYSDEDLETEIAAVKSKRRSLLKKTRVLQSKNSAAVRRAIRRGRAAVSQALAENELDLSDIEKELRALVPSEVGMRRLVSRNAERLFPSFAFMAGLRDPITRCAQRLSGATPAQFEMPLRFLQHIGYPDWRRLVEHAADGASRDELLGVLEKLEDTANLPQELETLDAGLKKHGLPDRTAAIQELLASWASHLYLSCAMLAVTMAEGRLWDVAELLNRRRLRIFRSIRTAAGKTRYHAYAWDAAVQKHKRDGRKLSIEKKPLTSGRELILRTRLGSLLNAELRSFLTDEHADYRNPLLHGRYEQPATRYDAVLAMLCCCETLREAGRIARGEQL